MGKKEGEGREKKGRGREKKGKGIEGKEKGRQGGKGKNQDISIGGLGGKNGRLGTEIKLWQLYTPLPYNLRSYLYAG